MISLAPGHRGWLLLPIVWMTALYALSSMRQGSLSVPVDFPQIDKLAHVIVYFVLVLSFLPWGAPKSDLREWLPFAVGSSIGFGIADELHQFWVPGREPDWGDLLANTVGALTATWVCSAGWSRRIVCRILG